MDTDSEHSDKPSKPKIKTRPRGGPSRSRLRAQNMITGKTGKVMSTSSEDSSVSESETVDHGKQDKQPAKTDEEEAYQADNEADEQPQPKGWLVTTNHGIIKRPQKTRKFRCKVCDQVFDSTKGLE